MVKEVRSRVGSKVNWAYMWNLDPGSLGELARRLNIDVDVGTLWRLAGGNPGALVRIRVDGLKRWVEEEVLAVVRELLDEARRELGERLWDELRVAVEDLDEADYSLKRLMLKHNIILYITGYKVSELPRERWVGRRYAYQIPAYHHALKLMVERANAKVTVEELLLALLASDGNLEDYVESHLEELFKIRVKARVVPPYMVEVRSKVRRGRTALIVNEGGEVNRMTALFTILGLADRGSTILPEEPETNLHPAIQYKLAGILSRVVREERKQLIITTHSEHLLLGVLNNVARGELSPNDVTVYYMYKDERGESRVEKLEVDESGRIKGGLPGFFEAEVEELLEMLAPKSVAVG